MNDLVTCGTGFISGHLAMELSCDCYDVAIKKFGKTGESENKPCQMIYEGVTEFFKWDRPNQEWYEPLVLES